ncbi:ABC transporter substrate-binding protein [Rhodopseudomonas palustris]|uniref:ABC transporter substrate-binding protein n=1 Tax=Rhodopseudomonas palustris TaxID=1076 RepID=UPI000E5C1396|nr:ABC transporter substrate-binding protein [Rhodopseudomonas palustris]QLH71164.1 ABC transporter substrate-binding protein [Rhodopseudomonas palustris]RHZ97384.1 ABC transporter substrate-binding protein [Rhodopseudomonas palustris]
MTRTAAPRHGARASVASNERRLCRWRSRLLLMITAVGLLASPAVAAPKRIASINMCTDQLLIALADPEQIVGLGPYARDPRLSWLAQEAERFPKLSGEAEDLLMLAPDVVLAGRYGKRATRELLRAQNIPLEEFDVPRTIDEVKAQIQRTGELLGHPERSDAMIAAIDKAALRARQTASRWHGRVLALSRRGWVTGGDSLLSSLLQTVGLSNSASDLGFAYGGFASLEAIVASRPDLLLVSEEQPVAEDQGKALLLHPAIQQAYPASRRIVIPDQLTVCGGAMLPVALDRLSDAMEQISQRRGVAAAAPRQ